MNWKKEIELYLKKYNDVFPVVRKQIINKKGVIESKTSWQFKLNGDPSDKYAVCKTIKKIFGITSKDFDICFDQAICGSGNEITKINTVWSSSLLSLLCFSQAIHDKKRIVIGNVEYTKCYFEFKNPVCRHIADERKRREMKPSNIDCVLTDDNCDNILFIESKMIEYVRDSRTGKPCKHDKLKQIYYDDNDTSELAKEYDSIINSKRLSDMKRKYYYGIKQIITHYSGIMSFKEEYIDKKVERHSIHIKEIVKKYRKGISNIRFMEILYDMSEIIKNDKTHSDDFSNYKFIEEKIASKIKGIEVLPLTTYQKEFGKNGINELANKRILKFFFHQ